MADDPSYLERWKNANILVIGANYGLVDSAFWSALDPYYIGVGIGESPWPNLHWNTSDWSSPDFWDYPTPTEKYFKRIFFDCSVGELMLRSHLLGAPLLRFLSRHIKDGWILFLYSEWQDVMDDWLQCVFTRQLDHTALYGIEALVASQQFTPIRGEILTQHLTRFPLSENDDKRGMWKALKFVGSS